MDSSQTAQRCRDYIRALEEERKKIQVFQRELPLCLQLVTSAIESVRQQMCAGPEAMDVDRPVLEEFIPLKPSSSSSEEDDGSSRDRKSSPAAAPAVASADKKPDWLKSVQLWNQHPEAADADQPPKKPVAVNVTGGAFQPFERQKHVVIAPVASAAPATSSTTSGSGGAGGGSSGCDGDDKKEKGMVDKIDKEKDKEYKDKESQSQSHRKTRRCWSPELHRRFLHALQLLGGSHAATPKQIRELMKVDGLTNDEVKSHLQKYRLHTRRPSPAIQSSISGNHPAPQFVVVGGIWMPPPPPDYATAIAHTGDLICAPPGEVYAPVASLPEDRRLQPKNNKQSHRSPIGPLDSEGRSSGDDHTVGDNGDDDTTHSASPATSSSSQTTTASPSPF